MNTRLIHFACLLVGMLAVSIGVGAQGAAFTYQGRLNLNGAPANGTYDLTFSLFAALNGGAPVPQPFTNNATAITNGLFTVTIGSFVDGAFNGTPYWLEIGVRSNGVGNFTTLAPRQAVTPTPYAIYAEGVNALGISGTLPAGSLSGIYGSAVTMNNAGNRFGGNGSNLTTLNASQLASGTVPAAALSNAWRIGGNVGITPGTYFVGTTDTNALELKVNNQRALRLEPTGSNDTVNVIGGSARNFVGAGVVAATIGGGGAGNYFGSAYTNRVEADFGTVSGGLQNTIQTNAGQATIGGGFQNAVQPYASSATISGGYINTIQTNAGSATISGGIQNTIQANADDTTIGGGNANTIQINADSGTIGGGLQNAIQPNAISATIGGGFQNTIQSNANSATLGGGRQNTIQPNALFATIPGGRLNSATNYAFAAGNRAKANHTGAFVWADATDTDFASSSSNQFLIRAAGSVGINKTNPATALDVNGIITATGFSGNGAGLTSLNPGNMTGTLADARLSTNVALRAGGNAFVGNQTIAGSVGIGTTTPTKPLEVQAAGDVEIGLKSTDLNGRLWTLQSSGNGTPGREQTFQIIDRTAGASRLLINSNGYVGIGTPTPAHKLTVRTPTTDYGFEHTDGDVRLSTFVGGSTGGGWLGTISNHKLSFFVNDGSASMTVDTTGNVGIGTISPSAKLEVNGTVTAISFSGQAGVTLMLGTTDNQPLEFKVNNQRALRLEPNVNAPNVIGGSAANVVTNGNFGAVIAGGGSSNYPNRVGAIYATVVGGAGNTASGVAATAMGQFTTASGYAATAIGFYSEANGFGSLAAGSGAKANHDGAFVWSDNTLGTLGEFRSTANNQFLIRAAGGVAIGTNDPAGAALRVAGTIKADAFLGMGTTLLLGTTDANALEFKVNGTRALRLEPTAFTDTVNVIGGSARNFVAPGVVGATIGGGGAGNYFGGAYTNRVEADFSTVSGGRQNTIQPNAYSAIIGGGENNTIHTRANRATIGGGGGNTIQFEANDATIGGGLGNMIQSNAYWGTIGGGLDNAIQPTAWNATIGGGLGNRGHAYAATIGGGKDNTIWPSASYATIGGGFQNTIQTNADFATIPGGQGNSATNYAFAAGRNAKADHTGAFVWADSKDEDFASTANDQFSIRARGGVRLSDDTPNLSFGNSTRQMLNLWGTQYGVGVQSDTLYSRCDATANGGFIWYKGGVHDGGYSQPGQGGVELMHLVNDKLYVQGSVVVDQAGENAGNVFSKSITFGTSSGEGIASRRTPGAANQYGLDFYTGGINRMTILNGGNVGIGTINPSAKLEVIGNILATGNVCANTVNCASDRNVKAGFEPVDTKAILEKVAALSITRWHYTNDSATPHLGAVAQDFHAAFAVGPDDKHIATVDADGVALAAIQGLNEKLEVRNQKSEVSIQKLQAENAELKRRLEKLEQLMNRQDGGVR